MADRETGEMGEFARLILHDGVDVVNASMTIDGPISAASYRKFDKQLTLLEHLQSDRITIYLNSGGGEVYSMFAYIDRIMNSACKIDIVAVGLVASAAIGILAAGEARSGYPHTSFMFHSIAGGIDGSLPVQDNELKHTKQLSVRWCKFLAERTKKPYAFWKSLGKHADYYFDYDKAWEWGLLNETYR